MKLLIKILSWFIYHANRGEKSNEFYRIKNKLLEKHGKLICYDIQFIEGKLCHTCAGTGIYSVKKDNYGFPSEVNYCYRCDKGWYKRPTWNILKRVSLGNYEFHMPWKRVYEMPESEHPFIIGYIEHIPTRYTEFCRNVLFFIYKKRFFRQRMDRKFRDIKYYYFTKYWLNFKYNFKRKTMSKEKRAEWELPF